MGFQGREAPAAPLANDRCGRARRTEQQQQLEMQSFIGRDRRPTAEVKVNKIE
jgi:hypothetical protein